MAPVVDADAARRLLAGFGATLWERGESLGA